MSVAALSKEPELNSSSQLQFVSHVKLNASRQWARCRQLTDTGASTSFVNREYVARHKLQTYQVNHPIKLALADGKVVSQLSSAADLTVRHGSHVHHVTCYLMDIGAFDIILGMDWLHQHDPVLGLREQSMTFNSAYCMLNCLQHGRPETILRNGALPKETWTPPGGKVELISGITAYAMAIRHPESCVWLEPHDWLRLTPDPGGTNDCDAQAFTTSMNLAAVSQVDFDKYIDKMSRPARTIEEITAKLPAPYRSKAHVFNPTEANKLPPRRNGVDHTIELTEDKPPRPHVYGLSRLEAAAVKEYIDEMLAKGFIRPSRSPFAAPVLVVKKPSGGLRICIDYRALNAITKKNRTAPPSIKETLARMNRTRLMTVLDVIAAFNTVRMAEGDEEKTAFMTRYGLYEYNVMPFGLCNAPGTFQNFINKILRDHLDDFCTAYLDDILVYSESEDLHIKHVLWVLEQLEQAQVFIDIDKCKFHTTKVKYLGLILTTEGIEMDPEKVSAVQAWQLPRCLKDVQAFLGFANFYRRFIRGFSHICKPLTALTQKDVPADSFPLQPGTPPAEAFEKLKQAFTTAPVLRHFDPDLETWLETDASDFVAAAVLSQMHDNVLYPVAFLSHKMTPAECNYEIYDKELLAIVQAFEEWRVELAGSASPIDVVTDHQALQYFMTSKRLNRRQARWAEFLAEFNFRIRYRPGRQGTKPDALTRRPGDLPTSDEDARRKHQVQVVLRPEIFEGEGSRQAVNTALALIHQTELRPPELAQELYALAESATLMTEGDVTVATLLEEIRAASAEDPDAISLRAAIDGQARRVPSTLLKRGFRVEINDCRKDGDLVFINQRLYVPEGDLRTRVLREQHDALVSGHPGRETTYSRVAARYYWPQLTSYVAEYVKACLLCRRSKPNREAKQGFLHPLPVPEHYWHSISMDFIVDLPPCKIGDLAYRHIFVIVDRLSKKKRFLPMATIDAPSVAQSFLTYVWREEGFPREIISDRGKQFTGRFWQELCHMLGCQPKLSTAFHPETDGQTEVANAWLKQYLRSYVNYQQDDWATFLPVAEFVANSLPSDSTGMAPFMATKGYLPRDGTTEPCAASDQPLPAPLRLERERAQTFVQTISQLQAFLRDHLDWARAQQAKYADAKRAPAARLKVGDWVMLDARNLKTKRPSRSLDFKNRGPFRVVRAIGSMAYELDLPPEMGRLHNVFHTWLLHRYDGEPVAASEMDKVELDQSDEDYDVDSIISCRLSKKKDPYGQGPLMEYKVKWLDWDGPPTWEPYYNLIYGELTPKLVAGFHRANPKKPPMPINFDSLVGQQNVVAAAIVAALANSVSPSDIERTGPLDTG